MKKVLKRMIRLTLRSQYAPKLLHRILRDMFNAGQLAAFPNYDSYRLLAWILLHHEDTYSELFQDLWCLYELQCKTEGFFVEFGAADGIAMSNTFLLEKQYNWRGILAEPVPAQYEQLMHNRNTTIFNNCVTDHSGETTDFFIAEEPAYSSLRKNTYHSDKLENSQKLKVTTLSLNDLLKKGQAPEVIDYISIDTEGAELDILHSFDFNAYDVQLFSVECNNRGDTKILDEFMFSKGYRLKFPEFSLYDRWYKKVFPDKPADK